MQLGYAQQKITPELNIELVGYIPSRLAASVEKDLHVKVVTLTNADKNYVWLTVDLLGLEIFYKDTLLKALKDDGIIIHDLQMFSTHTHSGPRCLNKDEYNDPKTLDINIEYFDYLVNQSKKAITESLNRKQSFTYKYAFGKIVGFQTNRINKDNYSNDDIFTVEITTHDNHKILLYSFSGHPTILDSNSTRISPDYVGEVAKNLESVYDFTMFFNAPCGDMSTRHTKKESTIEELVRLSKIASDCVFKTLENLSESKELYHYDMTLYKYNLSFKEFLSEDVAQERYDTSKLNYETALSNNASKEELRVLRGIFEGFMVNLHHSKQHYTADHYESHIYIADIDGFKMINLNSEVFSTLTQPLKSNNTWTLSLSDQYNTYLCDQEAYETDTYEALSSLYKPGEAEKMIQFIKTKL